MKTKLLAKSIYRSLKNVDNTIEHIINTIEHIIKLGSIDNFIPRYIVKNIVITVNFITVFLHSISNGSTLSVSRFQLL